MENSKNLQDEKSKPVTESLSSASHEITTPEEKIGLPPSEFKSLCSRNCAICTSGHAREVFDLRKSGSDYQAIISAIREKHGVVFSMSSLSRHLSKVVNRELEIASEIIHADIVDEAVAKSVHIQGITRLITYAIKVLEDRMERGLLPVDIDTLDKLVKLRYVNLAGLDPSDNQNILAIYKRSVDKYGVSFEQGALAFGRPATNLPQAITPIPAETCADAG